jgi:hypothetical protein
MLNRRKHMKKIVSIAFALVALSVILVGCKGEEAATPDATGTGTTNSEPTGTTTPNTPN